MEGGPLPPPLSECSRSHDVEGGGICSCWELAAEAELLLLPERKSSQVVSVGVGWFGPCVCVFVSSLDGIKIGKMGTYYHHEKNASANLTQAQIEAGPDLLVPASVHPPPKTQTNPNAVYSLVLLLVAD
jgi:hypothetical protein